MNNDIVLCQCGCGNPAPIAKRSDSAKGWKKGEPLRYRLGHNPIPRRNRRRQPLLPRFWAKVVKKSEEECWPWTASTRYGYGVIESEGKVLMAHRVSWEIHNGQIPGKLWVLHRCDNPSCVNPNHLFLGTPKDNADDMVRKGRHGNKKY